MPRRGENIYKRKDGRWEGRILKHDGRYRYIYSRTYAGVKEKMKNFADDLKPAVKNRSTAEESASERFETWLKSGVIDRVKPSTYENYYRCLNKYVIPYFCSTKENRITGHSAAGFVKYIRDNAALSDTYKRKLIAVFKLVLKEIL